jgi:Mn2+/Fe2+ NRAMP family transporter
MLIFVPFIIAGGLMWFVAYQMAPMGYEIPLSRAVVATILMALGDLIAKAFLTPLIGNWYLAAYFIISAVIVMVILRLKFLRSLMAVMIYFVVLAIGTVALGLQNHPSHPSVAQASVQGTSN